MTLYRVVKLILEYIIALMLLLGWLLGVVIAKGAVQVCFSIFLPFYAWYLVTEWIFIRFLN